METSVYPVRDTDDKSGVNLKNLNEGKSNGNNPFSELSGIPLGISLYCYINIFFFFLVWFVFSFLFFST